MLWRLHDEEFGANEFNPNPVTQDHIGKYQGGRFDSRPDDPYEFLYAAGDDSTAIAEVLLRDLPSDDYGIRSLPADQLLGKCVSQLRVDSDLDLVDLRSGRDLGAIGTDPRLTSGTSTGYDVTREWSAAIRRWSDWAQGLVWRSSREPEGLAYVFFGDRVRDGALETASTSICGAAAFDLIRFILSSYRVAVFQPG
ncbi:RES family NAD+ phosphorylase [Candidatus Poriferisodalis sp.]|uniref:RES family NAD+ phosphorylase n=1 Tax=Candidatus Poriferisodalis sp. TaxID=3101277 RepID=UPI003B5955EE